MNMYRTSRVTIFFLLLCVMGCGGGQVAERIAEMNSTPIRRLLTSYVYFQGKHGFKGPRNEKELKDFIANDRYKKGFDRVGIDTSNVDALFISDRDGQPFKVKYGISSSPMGFKDAVVFESEGVDGEVMVAFGGAKVEVMSFEESEKLFKSRKRVNIQRNDKVEIGGEDEPQ